MHRRRSSQRRPIRRRFCIEGLFFTVLGLALAYGTALGQADKNDDSAYDFLTRHINDLVQAILGHTSNNN